jgi:molecular chaperone DnaK (HSP70)
MNRLLSAVMDAKHTLSVRRRVVVDLEHQGRAGRLEISRELFTELTADLLERTAQATRQLLADAKRPWSDISRLLLAGGATRMPMVVDMLKPMSGMEPDRTLNPDEASARGAALYADYLLGKELGDRRRGAFEVAGVNSHSLAVAETDAETSRTTNRILIARNTPLPAQFSKRFTTNSDNQRSIEVQILEGEGSLPDACTAIGRAVIRDLPGGLPTAWPVEVTFQYGSSGRLNVWAVVGGIQRPAVVDVERAAVLSDDAIARWKRRIADGPGLDAFASLDQEPRSSRPEPAAEVEAEVETDADAAETASSDPMHYLGVAELVGIAPGPRARQWHQTASSAPAGISRWLRVLIGYVTSAVVGLGLGYLLLSWLRPASFPLPWW